MWYGIYFEGKFISIPFKTAIGGDRTDCTQCRGGSVTAIHKFGAVVSTTGSIRILCTTCIFRFRVGGLALFIGALIVDFTVLGLL